MRFTLSHTSDTYTDCLTQGLRKANGHSFHTSHQKRTFVHYEGERYLDNTCIVEILSRYRLPWEGYFLTDFSHFAYKWAGRPIDTDIFPNSGLESKPKSFTNLAPKYFSV